MRRARAWEVRLAAVGLGLILSWTVAGCGGGGVPDPSADTSAAGETAPEPASAEPSAPATRVARAEAEGETPAPKARGGRPAAEATPADPAATPGDADPAATVAKGDPSGTSELLNQANAAAAAPAPAAEGTAPAGEVADAGSAGGPGLLPPPGAPGYIGGPPGAPGSIGGPGGETPSAYGSGGGSGSGAPGMDPIPGLTGGDDLKGPADFTQPWTAVQSFLVALRVKDKDRLAEATALRAPQEAGTESRKKLFSTIVDLSISDETLNALARDLEGFQVVGTNVAKSTARLGVILEKPLRAGIQRVTITARREAKGWKVVDVSGISSSDGARTSQPTKAKGR